MIEQQDPAIANSEVGSPVSFHTALHTPPSACIMRRTESYKSSSAAAAAATEDDPQNIGLVDTFDSSEHSIEDGGSSGSSYYDTLEIVPNNQHLRIQIVEFGNGISANIEELGDEDDTNWFVDSVPLYIIMFAILGNASRVFLSRLFGSDCSLGEANAPDDFLAPYFSEICITNSGLTEQTGGALFLELPSNMVGSLVMGMLSSTDHPLPWFSKDHPLQQRKAFIAGLATGFCGCLTTFASWNTQMVRMLDGAGTVLGPQVFPALFGYAIGLCAAFSSFIMGRHLHEWLSSMHVHQETERLLPSQTRDEETGKGTENNETSRFKAGEGGERKSCSLWDKFIHLVFSASTGLPLFVIGLIACFLVGAVVYEIAFYREIVLETLVAPVGALIRWKLSSLNKEENLNKLPFKKSIIESISWIPMGTLLANILASLIAVLLQAIRLRFLSSYDAPWSSQLLSAIETGFCGSLSTVSTFIKEIFYMEKSSRSFQYAIGSLTLAMLLGLAVYSPIVRS